MSFTDYQGINYGFNKANYNEKTGIHYGVIPESALVDWFGSAEPFYGSAHCPKCGNEVKEAKGKYRKYEHEKHECADYVCHACRYVFGSESSFPAEVISYYIEDNEYFAESGSDNDIFIIRSPYYTFAQFCSPCAPSACYLLNPLNSPNEQNKAYCFGLDWFDEENRCPYPIYSVETNELIFDPRQ